MEDNYGANSPPCKLRVQAFSEQLKEKLHNIVITLLQNDREGVLGRQVAFTRLLDQLNIPYVIGDTGFPEIREEEDEVQESIPSDVIKEEEIETQEKGIRYFSQ